MRVDITLSLESTFSESVQTFCCVSVTPDILQKTELKRRPITTILQNVLNSKVVKRDKSIGCFKIFRHLSSKMIELDVFWNSK